LRAEGVAIQAGAAATRYALDRHAAYGLSR